MTVADNPVSTRMVSLLGRLAPNEGYTQSALESGAVHALETGRRARTPALYEPSIVIVCQGRKLGFLGEEGVRLRCAALPDSVGAAAVFDGNRGERSPSRCWPCRCGVDLTDLTDLILAIDQSACQQQGTPLGIVSTPLEGDLADATLRLLRALSLPLDAQVLGLAIVREICYRVLVGERGAAMRAALAHQGRFGRVAKVYGGSTRTLPNHSMSAASPTRPA